MVLFFFVTLKTKMYVMKKIVLSFILVLIWGNSFSQRRYFDEYEINSGYSLFQGDYGERGVFSSTLDNNGFLLGGKAFLVLMNYYRPNCYSCKHLKFPLIFNVGYTTLGFDKAYNNIDLSSNSEMAKVKAFSGSIFQSQVAFGVEYHIGDLNTISFSDNIFLEKFDPFIGASVGITAYVVKLKSELGDIDTDPNVIPIAFDGGVYNKPGVAPTFMLEGGFRYKINGHMAFSVNSRWMYYLSDKVDGLVPDPSKVDNLYNDWQFSPSIGVVFMLRNSGYF